MMARRFDCLLDETSEIIISVQILVTLWWTRRPYETLLLPMINLNHRKTVCLGWKPPTKYRRPTKICIILYEIIMDLTYLTWLIYSSPRDLGFLLKSVIVIPSIIKRAQEIKVTLGITA